MRKEYLLGVGVVFLDIDRLVGEGIRGGDVFDGDGKDVREEGSRFKDTREDGGENVDRVGRIFGVVGDVTDIDVLSQTSKLTCVR
jgi:hypothetical protein